MSQLTNEELAILIQNGDTDYYGDLWKQVEPIIKRKCSCFYTRSKNRLSSLEVEYDDLVQECYFALVDAVNAFDSKGDLKFTSYLNYPVKNRFSILSNNRTSSQKHDPMLCSTSLNIDVGTENPCVLGELVADDTTQADFDAIEQQDWNRALHEAEEMAISSLAENQQMVIRLRFFKNKSRKEISQEMGISVERVRQLELKALMYLRWPQSIRILEPFYLDTQTPEFDPYGLKAGRSISSTERNALALTVVR